MATYKVIQDIEAEDKFVGPLTLKQFIFAAGAVLSCYLSFFAVIKGAYFMLLFTLPPAMIGIFLAVPWSKDQPTEVWVLAKLRFYFKPRKRIWNQDGLQELVTITVPKKIEKHLTNELSQVQVKSRLKALADTIDTRGWAVKNSSVNGGLPSRNASTDRLVSADILPQQVSALAAGDMEDPMDAKVSPVAAQFSQMIQASEQTRKDQVIEKMEQARNPKLATTSSPQIPVPTPVQQSYAIPAPVATDEPSLPPSAEEKLLAEQLKKSSKKGDAAVGHLHTISAARQQPQKTDTKKAQAPMPETPSADIINLSQNNDLNVATIARQANRDDDANEVVISLR